MPATPFIPHASARSASRRRAFTLTELLVVIALIVLLVALLLAALNQVQAKGKETSTLSTMQAFSNACDAFQQEHDFYPGVVPAAILANDPQISGTENALLHLLGGALAEEESTQEAYDNFGGEEIEFDRPNGDSYAIKVNRDRIGEGPIIREKPYPAYFAPAQKDFAIVKGQDDPQGDAPPIPDLIDAWGQPVVYLRRQRTIGPLTMMGGGPGANAKPQFNMASMTPYTAAARPIGKLERDQLVNSILNTSNHPNALMGRLLEHPALPGQARGAYLLLSAGPDGIYLGREDGAGSPGQPVDDLVGADGEYIEPYGPKTFDEYDDVLLFGGG